jgi:hypothetical protein
MSKDNSVYDGGCAGILGYILIAIGVGLFVNNFVNAAAGSKASDFAVFGGPLFFVGAGLLLRLIGSKLGKYF